MSLVSKISEVDKVLSKKVLSIEARWVDRYVPDKVLLIYLNALDKRASPSAVDHALQGIEKYVPRKLRSRLISAADAWVPDEVANSRKICAVLAGVGKYIPDTVIPSEAADSWSTVKARFHIPTLVSKGRTESRGEQ